MMFLDRLWHDLRHACRMFVKNPGFTAIAVISIAFGTGGNVAIFSAADALLLRPLPVPRPSELITVGSKIRVGIATRNAASYPDYVDIRDRSQSFDGLLAFTSRTTGFSAHPGAAPQAKVATIVSGNFFRVLGIEPEVGRGFLPSEDAVPGRDAVTVLSYGVWQQDFAGDRSVLGRKVTIAGIDFTVVGVVPERFTGIDWRLIRDAVYVPLAMWSRVMNADGVDPLTARDLRALNVRGRLKPGVTMAGAQAELTVIGKDLERAYPDTNKDLALAAQTEFAARVERNPLDAGTLMILSALSLAVLCVACANVAGLLSSRAPVRAREIALRMAIGAGRARIVRQLITESLGVALTGGLGGIAIGYAGIILLRQIQYPTDIVAVPVMQLDRRAMIFSLALAMASAFVFGLGPAIQTTRVDLVNSLKAGDAVAVRRRRLTGRNALVALQVALSLVLLTMTVFALQIFRGEYTKGPGFRTAHLVKMTIDPSQARYTQVQSVQFFERSVDEARRVPGVRSAAVTSSMPLFPQLETPAIVPEGYRLPDGQTSVRPWACSVDESFFDTLGIPLLAGRAFRPTDTPNTPRVMIVSEAFAQHYWPGVAAVGRRVWLNDERRAWVEVVGVARTSKYLYPGEPPQELVYFPFRQEPRGSMVLLVETTGESRGVLAPLRDMLRSMDANVPAYDVQTIESFYEARLTAIGRVITRMVGGIGLMGMTLTVIGLYGLVSYAVSRRTREIGIRIAIGASAGRVLGMILRQGMTPAWFGVPAGLALSAVTARLLPLLAPFTYRIEPWTFFLVVPTLLIVTLFAAFVPARRAARVDPTVALRCD
jgi:predicted permease